MPVTMPVSPQLIPNLPQTRARASVPAMLCAIVVLALPGSAHALGTTSTSAATSTPASPATATAPATGGTTVPTTTTAPTATPTTTVPSPTTTASGGSTLSPSTTTTTPGATPTPSGHSGKISTPAIALAVLAALLALACAVWAAIRLTAFEPRWLSSARHALAEGGFRISATWAEFTDWARLGK